MFNNNPVTCHRGYALGPATHGMRQPLCRTPHPDLRRRFHFAQHHYVHFEIRVERATELFLLLAGDAKFRGMPGRSHINY
jgi:hypothetical protein